MKDDSFRRVDAVGYHVAKETVKVFPQIKTHLVKSIQSIETINFFPGKKKCKDHFPQATFEPSAEKEIRYSVFKIGNLVLAGISGELMTEIGMEIKKQSPFSNTVILTHCNGSSGYICTDKSFPEAGYEIEVTELMPGVLSWLVFAVICLFYWVIDVKGYKKWTFFFVVVGMNAITIWVGQRLIDFEFTAHALFIGFSKYLGIIAPIFLTFSILLVKWLFLWFLYKKKIFLKA